MLAEARARHKAAQRVPGALARRKMSGGNSSNSNPIKAPTAPPTRQARQDPIARKRERARLIDNPALYSEINRITGLPIIVPMDDGECEEYNRAHVLAKAFAGGFRMWPVQCEAISAYEQWKGLFAPIGVGWGKTLITQAIASAAFKSGFKKIILLIPSQVLVQLVKADFPFARRRIPIPYPIHVLGGKTASARRMLAHSGKKGLYIMPYSCLSTKDASENLEAIAPELIICDEADKLGNRRAARTKRIMNYVQEHEPRGVVLSGTITSKSIKDYYHLIKWCLGDHCPLPLSTNLANEWATKIDAQASNAEATGPIVPLVHWAEANFPEEKITEDTAGFRLAYKLRLKTAPGVVATGDADIGPSLVINNIPVKGHESCEGWDELERLREQVVKAYLTPNGDEIEHAIHTYKWLYELSAGFYNELTFPTPEALAQRERCTVDQAEEVMEAARTHHGSGQCYSKELRSWIDDCGHSGLDTPMLVGLDMSKHGPRNVGHDLYDLWKDHKDTQKDLRGVMIRHRVHKGTERELQKKLTRSLRDGRVVRVCPYKVDHAVEWASSLSKSNPGAIIWVWHKGIGQWVTEALQAAGLDPLYCPAGAVHNSVILEESSRGRVVVASIKAHGTGKNLQAFDQQLFFQWPRNAKDAEQALGRMHRNGQQSNVVVANTVVTSEFDQFCFAATLNDSLYIHQTTGNRQKLIYATYAPQLPKVFPSSVLRERGFQNKKLTLGQQKLMVERFGGTA